MEIIAKVAGVENDGYCTIASFADESESPTNYLILQMVNTPSPQDVQLRQDGVHLEVGEQGRGGCCPLNFMERKQH
jgi:hypothetical protein